MQIFMEVIIAWHTFISDTESRIEVTIVNINVFVIITAGFADAEAWVPWKEDTLSMIFSASKAISSICIALMVDR